MLNKTQLDWMNLFDATRAPCQASVRWGNLHNINTPAQAWRALCAVAVMPGRDAGGGISGFTALNWLQWLLDNVVPPDTRTKIFYAILGGVRLRDGCGSVLEYMNSIPELKEILDEKNYPEPGSGLQLLYAVDEAALAKQREWYDSDRHGRRWPAFKIWQAYVAARHLVRSRIHNNLCDTPSFITCLIHVATEDSVEVSEFERCRAAVIAVLLDNNPYQEL